MLEIHRGKGAIVIFVGGILAALIMNALTRALFDGRYYAEHIWPKFGTLWLAGLLYLLAGAYLRKHPTKVRGKDWIPDEAADHFFFIPVIYWGPIFFVVGILYVLYSFYRQSRG